MHEHYSETMHIVVFGANGRSGRVFIQSALQAGHSITAVTRQSTVRFEAHPNLTVFVGDVQNKEDVKKCIKHADAIVSLLGHRRHTPAQLQTNLMRLLSDQSINPDTKRIISLTGNGATMPDDTLRLHEKLVTALLKIFASNRISDGINHLQVLIDSDLDWTVLRASLLTNGALQVYSLTEHGPAMIASSRKTIAHAILQVLQDNSFVRKAPMISN